MEKEQNSNAQTQSSGPAPVETESQPRAHQRSKRPPRTSRPAVAKDSEFIEKVVSINRCTKVTKGNKRLAFSALVVVGDGKGRVGYGLGKAGEVAIAIRKSLIQAKKSMIIVPLSGSSIPHQINGECGSALVMLKPAAEGTGVIAAGPVRAICDAAGIRNILTKCHKSNNPINVVKATMDGLQNLKVNKTVATTTAAVLEKQDAIA